ncbi:MAG: hypothetical protein RI637_07075 [Acidimicrobiia bacterium]|nr:hypothetical protein [Acidimicrobiia bacterium]
MGGDTTMTEAHPGIILVGPFWTRLEATDDLGCTDGCLLGRNDVLRIGARLSEEVYPAFQFDHHHVREDIAEIVALLLRNDVTGAVISDWLVHPHPDLGGQTPLGWLDRGQPERPVLGSARRSIPELQAATAELRSQNLPYEGHYGPD